MKVYHFLSGLYVLRKKYAFKFFLGSIPVITICLLEPALFSTGAIVGIHISYTEKVVIVLLLTMLAVVVMLSLFEQLLSPIRMGKQALDDYVTSKEIPKLPIEYSDEVGTLLANIQATITQLDGLISEKSDMIDLLSHDLRSPVGRILSLSNLVKNDGAENKDLYADYINNECKGLLRMLENILLMLRENSHVFRLANVNLRHLIEETVSFFSFSASEKNLAINVLIDESIFIPVQPELFIQAVRNILGNAIKFSPDGKTITITGKQDMDKVSLAIQDQGLGFVPKDIQKIFDRFTGAGKKGTHGEASVGLGLYLSKKIVERHGGKLIAESEGVNKGASFTIVLYKLITKKRQGKQKASISMASMSLLV